MLFLALDICDKSAVERHT